MLNDNASQTSSQASGTE